MKTSCAQQAKLQENCTQYGNPSNFEYETKKRSGYETFEIPPINASASSKYNHIKFYTLNIYVHTSAIPTKHTSVIPKKNYSKIDFTQLVASRQRTNTHTVTPKKKSKNFAHTIFFSRNIY